MKKFIVANSGKEINFGDKVLIVETVNYPLGVAKIHRTAVLLKSLWISLLRMVK